MKRASVLLGLVVLVLGLWSQPAQAQRFEFHPFAGGLFPADWHEFQMKREGAYGLKFGGFLSDMVQLEGNIGWINHFEFRGTDPPSRAIVWEVTPSLNFFTPRVITPRVVPYVTVGVGGITGIIGSLEDDLPGFFDDDSVDLLAGATAVGTNGAPATAILADGDTFFTFSYGGGVKFLNLAGPLGLRADIRGRTIPNFFGEAQNWLEATGGLTFTWGER